MHDKHVILGQRNTREGGGGLPQCLYGYDGMSERQTKRAGGGVGGDVCVNTQVLE